MRGPTSANLFHLLKLEMPIASKFAVQNGIKEFGPKFSNIA